MLPLFLTLALDAANVVVPPPGSYRYNATVSGKSAGTSLLLVSKTDQGIKIEERGETNSELVTSKQNSTMLLDGSLVPTYYTASYQQFDQKMNAVVTFADRNATVTAGTDVKQIPLGGSSKSFIILDSSSVAGFFILPAQMRAMANGDTTVVVPGAGTSGFLDVIPDNKPQRPASVPPGDASVSFAGETPFVEWYDPATFVPDEVDMPGQNLVISLQKKR